MSKLRKVLFLLLLVLLPYVFACQNQSDTKLEEVTFSNMVTSMTKGDKLEVAYSKQENVSATFVSSDTNVATVEGNVVTAIGVGSFTLTGTFTLGEQSKKYEFIIEVKEPIGCNNKDLKNVIKNIDELPEYETITLQHEEQITSTREAYDLLSELNKTKVTNYEKLVSAERRIINLKEIQKIINLIEEIPSIDNISINDQNLIDSIKTYYENSDNEVKSQISNYDKLIEAKNHIELLIDRKEKIDNIENMINKLPEIDELTLEHEQEILNISQELLKLNDSDIDTIVNLNKYYSIKNRLEHLKQTQTNIENANKLIDLINNLPDIYTVTIDDKDVIENVLGKYNNVNEEVKVLVNNYDKLTQLKEILVIMEEYTSVNPYHILSCVSDNATSYTADSLILGGEGYNVVWHSSNPNLYYFDNGVGKVSRVFQTHKAQMVTITVDIEIENKTTITQTKEIKVDPVLFDDMHEIPVATYFQTSALSSYTTYSTRYKKEKTIFSDKAKDTLDIIYYAFANLDDKGNITLSNEGIVPKLIDMKEYNVRNVLCLAGVSELTSKYFTEVTADDTLRKKFVNNIMDYVEKYNFDGVDVDWESTGNYDVVASNMNKLIRDLRTEMDNRQDPNGSPYLLSIAVPAYPDGLTTSKFDFPTLNQYVDHYNIMSYALNDTSKATHLTPLYTSSFDNGKKASVDASVSIMIERGADPTKLIIGSGAYGKLYLITGTSSNSSYPGLGATAKITQKPEIPNSYASGTLFLNAIKSLLNTGKFEKYFEYNENNELVGSYLYNESDKLFVTYDSEEMIIAKYQYAKNINCGIMCWAYTQDTYDAFVDTIYAVTHNE